MRLVIPGLLGIFGRRLQFQYMPLCGLRLDGKVNLMKANVGVITLAGMFNYGNRLQAYATSKIYTRLGYMPVFLEIDRGLSSIDGFKLMVH